MYPTLCFTPHVLFHFVGGFWREDNVWVKTSRIQFVGACNPPTDAGRVKMTPRFLRHASLLLVDFPDGQSLTQSKKVYEWMRFDKF